MNLCYKLFGILLISGILFSCALPMPNWKVNASIAIEDLERLNAKKWFPEEFHNLMETYEHGEAILYVQKNEQVADSYYLLALQKSRLLKSAIIREEQKKKDEERRRVAEEAARLAEEKLMQQAIEAEERLNQREMIRLEEERSSLPNPIKKSFNKVEHQPTVRSYTVRRGETLPQIAARNEIYNDASLWTLIYRANRDQIRDPKQLWSGQVLTIPRGGTKKKLNLF